MHYKLKNTKFLNKLILKYTAIVTTLLFYSLSSAQGVDSTAVKSLIIKDTSIIDSTAIKTNTQSIRKKIDGVSAVVGDFIVSARRNC